MSGPASTTLWKNSPHSLNALQAQGQIIIPQNKMKCKYKILGSSQTYILDKIQKVQDKVV